MTDSPLLDPSRLPVHVGIIMDGNGRWAVKRSLPRTAGHQEGIKAAKRVVKSASDLGVKYLTLYTFSTENWKRAQDEVAFLMKLIGQHLKNEYTFYTANKIRVLHSGALEDLPRNVRKEIKTVTQDTAHFTGLTVNLAINYGGRGEIVRAVNRILNNGSRKDAGKKSIGCDDIHRHLDCPDLPEADLIIRTGGEMRLSNFLLWESAYAELYFDDKLWPDWGLEDLENALINYQKRNRRFGGVK